MISRQSITTKISLYFHTLKYLKLLQIYFLLVRKIYKPKIIECFKGELLERSTKWEHLKLYKSKIDKQLEASFLNHTKKLDLPADWNNESPSKLWVYNLHYFEDLLSNNAEKKIDLHLQLLNSWIDQNPVGYGNGWEPYPSSLRIVNVLKAWLNGLNLDKKILNSVFVQASFLSGNLEKHLLGNHLFVNVKALLFAGVIFKNNRWTEIAEKELYYEIPEQILEDGANFELSPMYHSLILVDMLDMLNLSMAYPKQVSCKLVSLLNNHIPKMLRFMEAMSHPDGSTSFFNDSSNGIAPRKEIIECYAEKLGFKINVPGNSKYSIIDNKRSGYICATSNDNKLIFDASPVGPDYIPGHAHADTLSFEMSIGAQLVFVNSGTSEYGLSPTRIKQRKTASHNTVEVDGKDSSQVWSGFRVAKRAKIIHRSCSIDNKGSICIRASHNGYKSIFSGCIHTRIITFTYSKLIVNDMLEGSFKTAKSFFHFHPSLDVYMKKSKLIVEGKDFLLYSNLRNLQANIYNNSWHPEFGISVLNKTLEINFDYKQIEVVFEWNKKK